MVISVNDVMHNGTEPYPFSFCEAMPPQDYAGRTITFDGPATVEGVCTYDGKTYKVDAGASVPYRTECALCGKPFTETVAFAIDERFVREAVRDPEDDETYPYTGDKIDLEPAFWDNLFLSLPLTSVCKPDCKGLCPVCGADRNLGPCGCRTEKSDNPFGALQHLLNENKEV